MEIKDIKNINDLRKEISTYLESTGFTQRKLTDTPTDDLQVTPRRYVNMNGVVANRPRSSIASMGQSFFASDTGIPMTFNSTTNKWVNGIGSVVASGQ